MPNGKNDTIKNRKHLKQNKNFAKNAKGSEEKEVEVWIISTETSFPVCPGIL